MTETRRWWMHSFVALAYIYPNDPLTWFAVRDDNFNFLLTRTLTLFSLFLLPLFTLHFSYFTPSAGPEWEAVSVSAIMVKSALPPTSLLMAHLLTLVSSSPTTQDKLQLRPPSRTVATRHSKLHVSGRGIAGLGLLATPAEMSSPR
ncbi:hypothetical protein PHLGIDRAFT_333599 [Phlebiopsis gigantea 11061_1 CR5-6]|uniref:Uncharacterized protein n=1 Tax=Phlebiopsis gigantea (strain 11061_1 CR5-6) TaxID=745531 RepID=A0A0C3SAM7_PHLG1|nr:hypothetical protein PHLGIDRAFT_333599 [Phlebiopsis gigantea 11061_1 CR5-6]